MKYVEYRGNKQRLFLDRDIIKLLAGRTELFLSSHISNMKSCINRKLATYAGTHKRDSIIYHIFSDDTTDEEYYQEPRSDAALNDRMMMLNEWETEQIVLSL